jgi:uncharacterized protein (DUF1499 family)
MYKIVPLLLLLLFLFIGFRFFFAPYTVRKYINHTDFKEHALPDRPNFYLLCPEDRCIDRERHGISPVYLMTINALREKWEKMIEKQPRVYLLATKDDGLQRIYVQYSGFWGFPDIIHVRFVPVDDDETTFYLLSQSIFGHYDFGVNKARVKHWLQGI